jgi:periplasmic protein TonB
VNTTANPAFRPAPDDMRAMNRALAWSIGVHVAVVVVFAIVPRDWITEAPRPVMTISIGGTAGPRSTGTTSIGGRTVEQVAPPARRPEPIRPTPRAEPEPVAPKHPPPAARPAEVQQTVKRIPPAVRPPTTGPQLVQGNTPVDTGARGQGQGLTFGGGGTGGETNLADFCCPEYIQLLTAQIDANWQKAQAQRGTTVVRFSILRNGSITDLKVVKPSGSSLLDRASRRALEEARLPPLPVQYASDRLTVNLTFPYEGR